MNKILGQGKSAKEKGSPEIQKLFQETGYQYEMIIELKLKRRPEQRHKKCFSQLLVS